MRAAASHLSSALAQPGLEIGRHYVRLAEQAHQAGDQANAERFIGLAYQALSLHYRDAPILDEAA